jgi:hypothetical protein
MAQKAELPADESNRSGSAARRNFAAARGRDNFLARRSALTH